MTPSQELVNLVEGARNPQVSVSPDRSVLLLQDRPSLPAIEEIAQPELRLAGIRINPNTNGSSRPGYVTGRSEERRVGKEWRSRWGKSREKKKRRKTQERRTVQVRRNCSL